MVTGHGTNFIGNMFGYKVIGQWLLTATLIGFRVIGKATVMVTGGLTPAGCITIYLHIMAITTVVTITTVA
jgi:hypothetical protein